MAGTPQEYRVLVGINYPPNNKRAEPGDVVTDLPDYAIDRLVADGTIEKADAVQEQPPAAEPVAEPAPVEAPAVVEAPTEPSPEPAPVEAPAAPTEAPTEAPAEAAPVAEPAPAEEPTK